MVDEFPDQCCRDLLQVYRVPGVFVHMKAGDNVPVIGLPEYQGALRIAFQVDLWWEPIQGRKGKHFVHHLKHKDICTKGKPLGNPLFCNTIFSESFYMQGGILFVSGLQTLGIVDGKAL